MSNLRITHKDFNQYLVDFWEVAEVGVNKVVVVVVAVLEICLASEQSHFLIFI
jgi:hypothetical protein